MIPLPNHPNLFQKVKNLKGVGPQIEKALFKRGYETVSDLIALMPSRYQDRRKLVPLKDLVPDQEVLTCGRIESIKQGRFPRTGRRYFEIMLTDGEVRVPALWFSLPAHMRHTLEPGRSLLLFGRAQKRKGRLSFTHPELLPWPEKMSPAPEIRPVYPEFDDVRPGSLRRIMVQARQQLSGVPFIFPQEWLDAHELTDPIACLQTLHLPPAERPGPLPRPEESKAWRNLALFELLFLQLTLLRSKTRQTGRPGWSCPPDSVLTEKFLAELPFQLTESQKKALREIRQDMAAPSPMNRLLQGDVGSGKTVVALAAIFTAVAGGRQAALMAPTEILARQHFRTIRPHAERLGLKADLLVGNLPEAQKAGIRDDLTCGRTHVAVGTHALISEGVRFAALGLAVIDEQHRFGVAQRLALRAKADGPDILVMTATPIPRSLSLVLYGDLDLSTIRGRPPGRRPVRTRVFGPDHREAAYQILVEEINQGGQAYVVAPRITEAGDDNGPGEDLSSAEGLVEFVRRKVPPDWNVKLVHGRMKSEEREKVMDAFRKGKVRVLVATTVIEVGLDVAGATLVLIEGAERFGLAQLHQLRGRVGRGDRPGQCLLVAGENGAETQHRLQVLTSTDDGFVIAEEDLKLRGPGDPAGVKQAGLPSLTWARLPDDLSLLLRARSLAEEIISHDPELEAPAFKLVRHAADRLERTIQAEMAGVG